MVFSVVRWLASNVALAKYLALSIGPQHQDIASRTEWHLAGLQSCCSSQHVTWCRSREVEFKAAVVSQSCLRTAKPMKQ